MLINKDKVPVSYDIHSRALNHRFFEKPDFQVDLVVAFAAIPKNLRANFPGIRAYWQLVAVIGNDSLLRQFEKVKNKNWGQHDAKEQFMLYAVRAGNLASFNYIVKDRELDINGTDADSNNSLHIALRSLDVELIRAVLIIGVDPYKKNNAHLTPYNYFLALHSSGLFTEDDAAVIEGCFQTLFKKIKHEAERLDVFKESSLEPLDLCQTLSENPAPYAGYLGVTLPQALRGKSGDGVYPLERPTIQSPSGTSFQENFTAKPSDSSCNVPSFAPLGRAAISASPVGRFFGSNSSLKPSSARIIPRLGKRPAEAQTLGDHLRKRQKVSNEAETLFEIGEGNGASHSTSSAAAISELFPELSESAMGFFCSIMGNDENQEPLDSLKADDEPLDLLRDSTDFMRNLRKT